MIIHAFSGIGAAVCQRLASKGASILIVFTSDSSLQPTQQLCRYLREQHNVDCEAVQANLSDPTDAVSDILNALRSLAALMGSPLERPSRRVQVDILVNCAGVSSNQALNDSELGPIDAEEFNRVYSVNVLAPLLLTQALAPHLPTDRSGRIVNVSSVSSSIGYEGQSVYAGSKAALEAMTRTWSRELASRATVNAVNPGPAWGDMYAKAGETFWKQNQKYVDAAPLASYAQESEAELAAVRNRFSSEEEWQKFHNLVLSSMGGMRPAFADEIAGTIDMLCSEEAAWTTGSVVCANGGMKMSIA